MTIEWLCDVDVRWRGSIYKLIWRDFLLYAVLYYSITILYKFFLTPESQGYVYGK